MEIYHHYVDYCNKNGKSIPDPYRFWKHVLIVPAPKGYSYLISKSGFTHWLTRLQIPPAPFELPYIWRDPITKAWCLKDVTVVKISP